jgi:hypothetical protein
MMSHALQGRQHHSLTHQELIFKHWFFTFVQLSYTMDTHYPPTHLYTILEIFGLWFFPCLVYNFGFPISKALVSFKGIVDGLDHSILIGGAKNIEWYITCIVLTLPLFHPPRMYHQHQENILLFYFYFTSHM